MSTGVYYTQAQQTAMGNAILQARQALAAGDYSGVKSALNNYYSVQVYVPDANGNPTSTVMRGYAQAALQVLNSNTQYGQVANQEIADAVGNSNYTAQFQATLAFDLAETDHNTILNNNFQVPTLADVAQEHMAVYGDLGIPGGITSWGGTAFTALGQDFTLGMATPAERSDMTPPSFANMPPAQIEASIQNDLQAGIGGLTWDDINPFSSGLLNTFSDYFVVQGLQLLFQSKYPLYSPNFYSFSQNANGTYQVAELQTGIISDAGYGEGAGGTLDVSVRSATCGNSGWNLRVLPALEWRADASAVADFGGWQACGDAEQSGSSTLFSASRLLL